MNRLPLFFCFAKPQIFLLGSVLEVIVFEQLKKVATSQRLSIMSVWGAKYGCIFPPTE